MAWKLIAALGVAALALTACSADAREAQAADAGRAFVAAEPAEACALLAPKTRKKLEKESGTDCATALQEVGLPAGGDVEGAEVAVESAQVRLADQTIFLARFPEGWLVTAAGCQREDEDPAQPYDCEVES
ncbi:hypothetical protein GCM10025789_17600 [Tessaracoccus lubricantis]|uniref:Subtilisin inhibitor domain-containing protein n=1 Tax=Tessaracoccus lubricantis TaxID=545543 RepID=A0ABP9FDH1_9ACTN